MATTKLEPIDFVAGETCEDCVWFVAPHREPDKNKFRAAPTGKCHRRAPTMVQEGGVMALWPQVNGWSDVCGDGQVIAIGDDDEDLADDEGQDA